MPVFPIETKTRNDNESNSNPASSNYMFQTKILTIPFPSWVTVNSGETTGLCLNRTSEVEASENSPRPTEFQAAIQATIGWPKGMSSGSFDSCALRSAISTVH